MDEREKRFLKRWAATRQKGKTSFLLKGTFWSILAAVLSQLFTFRGLPLAEIYLSYNFLLRLTVYMVAGTLVAAFMWRTNCKRHDALSDLKTDSKS